MKRFVVLGILLQALAAPDEESWTDTGAVPGGGPRYFYQVLGRTCSGATTYP